MEKPSKESVPTPEIKPLFNFTVSIDIGAERDELGNFLRLVIYEINGHHSGFTNSSGRETKMDPYFRSDEFQKDMTDIKSRITQIAIGQVANSDFKAAKELVKSIDSHEMKEYYVWREKYKNIIDKTTIKELDDLVYSTTQRPIFSNNYSNPEKLELLTRDKRKLYASGVIPKENMIREWKPGDSFESRNKWWVLKLPDMQARKGMKYITDRKLKFLATFYPKYLENFIVQEFIKNNANRHEDIRVNLDVRVFRENGKLKYNYEVRKNKYTLERRTGYKHSEFSPYVLGKYINYVSRLNEEENVEVDKLIPGIIENLINYQLSS